LRSFRLEERGVVVLNRPGPLFSVHDKLATSLRLAASGIPRLAVEVSSGFGIDVVGVDLLPDGRGGWVVLELNGAVDLTA
jgi:glutathione synthase/RimK-type ligase-like ATP-grasp enzyme